MLRIARLHTILRPEAVSMKKDVPLLLKPLLPPVLLNLLDRDHLDAPLLCELEAVVPPCHVAVWVVRLDQFADDACGLKSS